MITLDELYLELLNQGNTTGGEPEYLEIKTPITDDKEGWYIAWQWMHHDGDILQHISRGQTWEEAASNMLEALISARKPDSL